jgi:organic radical activating enzyme
LSRVDSNQPGKDLKINIPPGSEWLAIQAYQNVLNEEKIQKEIETSKEKKSLFKKSLDKQIELAKQVKEKEKELDKEYLTFISKDINKFHEEERLKKEEIQRKHHEELLIRKQQIIEREQFKKAEIEELLRMERENMKKGCDL